MTSKTCNNNFLAANCTSDLEQVVYNSKIWLVSFKSSKTKLLSFHNHRERPFLLPVQMAKITDPYLELLLGTKFTSDLKWSSCSLPIAKETGMMVGSFFRTMNFLIPTPIHHLYKSKINPKMEYCCHIWSGSPECCIFCWKCNIECVGS